MQIAKKRNFLNFLQSRFTNSLPDKAKKYLEPQPPKRKPIARPRIKKPIVPSAASNDLVIEMAIGPHKHVELIADNNIQHTSKEELPPPSSQIELNTLAIQESVIVNEEKIIESIKSVSTKKSTPRKDKKPPRKSVIVLRRENMLLGRRRSLRLANKTQNDKAASNKSQNMPSKVKTQTRKGNFIQR